MITPIISVIVPVYKAEKYLQECIDSILAQNFTDFELILVNDGSPDSCGAICDRNAAKDTRIKVIHQDNCGATRARANGAARATGEFITFVDGDDTLPPTALSTLLAPADKNIDIVLGLHQRLNQTQICPKGIMTSEQYKDRMITLNGVSGGPVAKLFRRHLVNQSVFNLPREVRIGEDAIMNIHIAYNTTQFVYQTGEVVYHYRDNPESAFNTLYTPEVIALYQKYRLAAIRPEDLKRCLPNGLAYNLIVCWNIATGNRIYLPPSTEEAHRYLLSIAPYSGIKFGFLTGALFRSRNPFIRVCVLLIRTLRRILHI